MKINKTDFSISYTINDYRFDRSNVKTLDIRELDVSNANNLSMLFHGFRSIKSLDVSKLNTSAVTDMSKMFGFCSSLASLDLSSFNTNNVTNMSGMLEDCKSLTSLDLSSFDTSKVTYMISMFDGCSSLTSLDLSNFNFKKAKNVNKMFANCSSLTDLKFGKNLKVSLDLSDCPLTYESALSVIDGLAKVEEQQKLTLSKTTYKSLTAEDIRQVEAKNWKINNL